jgi:methyl-accepting chemotaxis protein
VIERVGKMALLTTNIAENVEHQSLALQQITAAVAELDNVTQQNAAVAEEETAAARKLVDETHAMTDQIEQFRFTEWEAANDLLPERDRQPRRAWRQRPVDLTPQTIVPLKQRLS